MPVITGTSGPDYLVGIGSGDTINGGAGDDTIVAEGSGDTLTGGPGGDTFAFGAGFANGATITDWELGDHVAFATLPANYRIAAAFQGQFADFASAQRDALSRIVAGAQLVVEGYGSNTAVFVDSNANHTIGDTLVFQGKDLSWFGGGAFIGLGATGTQQIGDSGPNAMASGAGNDIVVGGKDNDLLFGDAGNDTLDGGDGNDQVRGGQGDDVLFGGAGNDFISGDRGNDTESGGAGADLFHGSQDAGIDRVLDFNLAEGDRVMLDPGTTFTVHQVGADTVIDMGPSPDGSPNQMILVGVQMSTLTGTWIFEG